MIAYYWCQPTTDSTPWEIRAQELPEGIRAHAQHKKGAGRQQQSVYGYWLLQKALSECFDYRLDRMTLGASGKPFLSDHYASFSISHSGNVVGVALSERGRIGLDVQAQRHIELEALSSAFFSVSEQEAIRSATQPEACVFQYWSKKEALLKAVGGTLLDHAAQTDVRGTTTLFDGSLFHFLALPHPHDGAVWMASELPFENFCAKRWAF